MRIDTDYLRHIPTPVYYYDLNTLRLTLEALRSAAAGRPIKVHYALKANGEKAILDEISRAGLGADCVSGNEIQAALDAGIPADKIYYAGVGKTDREIILGIQSGIGCFNVESVEELAVINDLAQQQGKKANVALRVNPNIDAHTHHYITTGLEENKFGIDMRVLPDAVSKAVSSEGINLVGLHFHIGSQITTMEPYVLLCQRVAALIKEYREKGIEFKIINLGGGYGVDYNNPTGHPIPDFKKLFDTVSANLPLAPGQEIHFELGRSIVAQCGALISRVLYIKEGIERKFAIIDAGMTELIRPALYKANHKIVALNPSDTSAVERYDVVGPVCESSDTFARDYPLPRLKRGDMIAILSAGAYGQSMASTYNMRDLVKAVYREN